MTRLSHDPAPAQPAEHPTAEPGAAADAEASRHGEWLLDESLRETFPASDPISPADPARRGNRAGRGVAGA